PNEHKDPWLAMFLSRMLPGLGHAYAGKRVKGMVVFIVLLIAAAIARQPFANALSAVLSLVAGVLSFRVVSSEPEANGRALRVGMVSLVGSVMIVVIAVFIRGFVIQAFRVPSESMAPTMMPDDFVFVDKTWGQRLHRGDLVVFDWPL